MINVKINGKKEEFAEGTTILTAAKSLGYKIPTLCNHDHIEPFGGCRVCLVEVANERNPEAKRLLPSCTLKLEPGMIINTDTEQVIESRTFMIQLLLSRCPDSEEMIKFAAENGVTKEKGSQDIVGEYLLQEATPLRKTKCILCGLCVRVCAEVTERDAISFSNRGMKRRVTTPFDKFDERCIGCGSCAYVCPTNTITVEETD